MIEYSKNRFISYVFTTLTHPDEGTALRNYPGALQLAEAPRPQALLPDHVKVGPRSW